MKKKTSNEEAIIIAQALREWFTVFLPDVRSASSHTLRSYHDGIKLFIEFLQSVKGIKASSFNGECFKPIIIQEWIKWMKETRKCANATCNQRVTGLKSFLSFLSQKDSKFIFLELDAKKVKSLRAPKNNEIEFPQDALESFFSVINIKSLIGKRDFTIFYLMYSIGARINEILSLRYCDVHLDLPANQKYITIVGKGEKLRTPPIIPEVAVVLEGYISKKKHDSPTDYIFTSSHGKNKMLSQCAINDRLKYYASLAHKKNPSVPTDVHSHCLRHARATHWLEEGLSLPTIQKLMGHSDIRTTMRYVYVSPQQKAMALATLEDETQKNISKKWKDSDAQKTLKDFIGI